MTVPVPIPTTDGRHFAEGLVVMTYVEGGPPETEADWRRVADTLRQLHRLTHGWPQRPGWRSSTDLLHAETGTRIDLGAMPAEGVARCRAAWARLTGRERCVVHGDPNPGNIRMTADRVALIDWDESHVDVPDLDLVLPHNAAGLDDDTHDVAAQASAAWEAAVCWDPSGTDTSRSSGSPKFERSERSGNDRRLAAAEVRLGLDLDHAALDRERRGPDHRRHRRVLAERLAVRAASASQSPWGSIANIRVRMTSDARPPSSSIAPTMRVERRCGLLVRVAGRRAVGGQTQRARNEDAVAHPDGTAIPDRGSKVVPVK